MALSKHLAPFPMPPRDADAIGQEMEEEFVSALTIQQVLLGASGGLPITRLASEEESFAGRGDVKTIRNSPFLSVVESRPAARIEPSVLTAIHPVFDAICTNRRPTPPRIPMDVERDFGQTSSRAMDHWWIVGAALAVCAITLSGTVIEFTSREAVRRAGLEQSLMSAPPTLSPVTAPDPGAEKPEKARPMAAASDPR